MKKPGVGDVAGLEQADERGEPREALRVGVGTPDEREHLELALEVGAVVGEHVREVVLREVRRRAPRCAGQTRSPGRRTCRTPRGRACPAGRSAERDPARFDVGVGAGDDTNGSVTRMPACSSARVDLLDVVDEAAATQVHPRQAVGSLRVAPGDAHEVVVDAERIGVLATRCATSVGSGLSTSSPSTMWCTMRWR